MLTGRAKLDWLDLDILGKLAFNRGFYDRATEWLDAAVWKAEKTGADKAEGQRLRSTLKTMQNKHDQVLLLLV